jgi:dUTP pyrophosphatase
MAQHVITQKRRMITMKIKLIKFEHDGVDFKAPFRAHENDAGADVYSAIDVVIPPHTTVKIPLGFGIELPDGFQGNIYPRTGMASKGIVTEMPPVDSGYRGEIHAITSNLTDEPQHIEAGTRIGQLVITPIVLADFIDYDIKQRGTAGFGSTGYK